MLLEKHDCRLAPLEPPKHAKAKILQFANMKARPFYLGQLASDIGWSLERTEQYAEAMVLEGLLRHASKSEIESMSGFASVKVYCVVNISAALAYTV
jgi:hypothetical protein